MNEDPTSRNRPACSECHRRKQKCDREWPCNHCQKRKVANQCRFIEAPATATNNAARLSRKRALDDRSATTEGFSINQGDLESLGYMPPHSLFDLIGESEPGPTETRQEHLDGPFIQAAIQVLPPRKYTDYLVQRFLDYVNYHYYILHAPTFLDEYKTWWSLRNSSRTLSLEWTSLLLTVCACSMQYLDRSLETKLRLHLGESFEGLSEQLHEAGRDLSSRVRAGCGGITTVYQLLYSCYWYKSEARFPECWHALTAAAREAQEMRRSHLGQFPCLAVEHCHIHWLTLLVLHTKRPGSRALEFDREMERRVWCILNAWDWQLSALLSRPLIIDRAASHVELPHLSLEGDSPSPILHMKLHSQLINKLSRKFGNMSNITSPSDVQEFQFDVEAWVMTLPPRFSFPSPDKSQDEAFPWLVLHRHYLYTVTYSLLLGPMRRFLSESQPQSSHSGKEQEIRAAAVNYALLLIDALKTFFDHVYPEDTRYHAVLFSTFDTGTVLCSALLHDTSFRLPRRAAVLAAISVSLNMLRELHETSSFASASYRILSLLAEKVSPSLVRGSDIIQKKARTHEDVSSTPLTVSPDEQPCQANAYMASEITHDLSDWLAFDTAENFNDATITPGISEIFDIELDNLNMPWDWPSLDL
ncbi:hypothetical protein GQ53DRAFT_688461 [Thozetella sp. PMI_491]|nr:hypothetical protein GQ53DRAFT_688461 [Thozetella sp. PMI_491]